MKRHSRPVGRIRTMRPPPSNPHVSRPTIGDEEPVRAAPVRNAAVAAESEAVASKVIATLDATALKAVEPVVVQHVTQVVACKHDSVDMNVFAKKAETAAMIAALAREQSTASKSIEEKVAEQSSAVKAVEAKVVELKGQVDEIKPCNHVAQPKDVRRRYMRVSRSDSQQSVTFIEVFMMLPDHEEPTPVRVWSYETSENDSVQGWQILAKGGMIRVNFSYHAKTDIKEPALDVSFIRIDAKTPGVETTKLSLPDIKADMYTVSYIDIDLDAGTYMVALNSASTIGIIDMWY